MVLKEHNWPKVEDFSSIWNFPLPISCEQLTKWSQDSFETLRNLNKWSWEKFALSGQIRSNRANIRLKEKMEDKTIHTIDGSAMELTRGTNLPLGPRSNPIQTKTPSSCCYAATSYPHVEAFFAPFRITDQSTRLWRIDKKLHATKTAFAFLVGEVDTKGSNIRIWIESEDRIRRNQESEDRIRENKRALGNRSEERLAPEKRMRRSRSI